MNALLSPRGVSWTFGLALLVGTGMALAEDVQPAVWHRAPDFTLRSGEGKLVQLSREGVSDLNPDGLVRLRDALWLAEAWPRFGKGQGVEVMDGVGTRMRVRPWT